MPKASVACSAGVLYAAQAESGQQLSAFFRPAAVLTQSPNIQGQSAVNSFLTPDC